MTESERGHRGISESEAARVRGFFWAWWDAEVAAGRKPTRREYGRLVGVKGEAVSQFIGQRNKPGSWKNKPSRDTAKAAAKLAKKPSNSWEDDHEQGKPADLDSKRLLQTARDLSLDDSVMLTLAGGDGARMKHLSEMKRKAVLGAVHLLGFPLEMVIEAAEQVVEHADDDPESLFTRIAKRLRDKPGRSGSYPTSNPLAPRAAK